MLPMGISMRFFAAKCCFPPGLMSSRIFNHPIVLYNLRRLGSVRVIHCPDPLTLPMKVSCQLFKTARNLPELVLLLCGMASSLQAAGKDDPDFIKVAQPFIENHCMDCHDADEKKGGFDLTALKPDFADVENFASWLKVHDRVASGEMPPKKKERPPVTENAAFLGWLAKDLTLAEASKATDGGRSTVRRMNRVEYECALRDLLALPLLHVKELLPEDGQQFGFDKVAGALDISHIQMMKYLQAADVALQQAVVTAVARPETKTWREPAMQQDSAPGLTHLNFEGGSGDEGGSFDPSLRL